MIGLFIWALALVVIVSVICWVIEEWRARNVRCAKNVHRAAKNSQRSAIEADCKLMQEMVDVSTYDSTQHVSLHQEACAMCKEDFVHGCTIRGLPCQHALCETCLTHNISVT